MKTLELLSKLNSLNIRLYREGDRLKCDAPQDALTSDLKAEISRQKQDLLAILATPDSVEIQPVSRDQPIPLSLIQQGIWFLDQLRGSNATFNIVKHIRFKEAIDPVQLNQALSELVIRHETLRTCIVDVDGAAIQKIVPPEPVELPTVDLSDLPKVEQTAALKAEIDQERATLFDLTKAPLFRAKLFRLAQDRYWLTVIVHHIVADGWSMNVLSRDIRSLYASLSRNEPISLPKLKIQYADFAVWQRDYLAGDALEKHLTYWRQQLEGPLPELQLPTDYPRPEQQDYRGDSCHLRLSEDLTQRLKAVSQQQKTTLFMLLLAGFQLLLHRYSGQDDIIVGAPISGRPVVETEALIGAFINSLALRTKFSQDMTFLDLLKQVNQVTLDAYAHQAIPFERVVEEVKPERSLNRHPIFEVMLNFLSMPSDNPNRSKLRAKSSAGQPSKQGVKASKWEQQEAKFSVTLYVSDIKGQLRFHLKYQTALFKPERMTQLLEQFTVLLEKIAVHPEAPIASYSLLTPASQETLPNPATPLVKRDYDLVTHRLAHWGHHTPDHVAIAQGKETWSYGEIERMSNQLARHLRNQGIQFGDKVAIYAHRSPALVWAMLGVLKAGGAFVILDPTYPPERLLTLVTAATPQGWIALESAGPIASVLAPVVESIPHRCSLPPLPHGGDAASYPGDREEATAVPVAIASDDLAYIAFTSGSTGNPKGILGSHRPLSHFLDWYSRHLELDQEARVSLLSGLAHDPLLRDIFTPLWCGGRLCIPDAEQMTTPGYLCRWLEQSGVTVTHVTPAMGQLLSIVDAGQAVPAEIPALQHLVFSGDLLTRERVRQMRQLMPNATLLNGYGATETPQLMACFEIPDDADCPETIPLGQGIEGVQLLIVRDGKALAGVGEVGEIYIRTPYLSQGYLQNDALTRSRFVANPVTGDPQDKVYTTGDLARYWPDGSLQYLGRGDNQVKIRGFRVELGEIETRLLLHPAVKATVVTAHGSNADNKQIVAYVVPDGNEDKLSADLRDYLQRHLPSYMVPSVLKQLDTIPLTPNGKVDWSALPSIDPAERGAEEAYAAPRTATEEALAEIWSQLLTLEQVGIDENFFALGGHSLLAAQAIARIRSRLEVEVSLRQLFETPTIAGLAHHIQHSRQNAAPGLATIQPTNHQALAPLSFAQQRLWFVTQLEQGSTVYNMSRRLRFRGDLNIAALQNAVEALVHRHDSLRTQITVAQGEPRQQINPPSAVPLPITDLIDLPDDQRTQQQQTLIAEEKAKPFDLTTETPIRFRLLKVSHDEHIFMFVIHHIVSDDWSIGIIMREIHSLYTAFIQDQPSPLAALPIQYADFAIWQRDYLRGSTVDTELRYWTEQLGGELPLPQLPLDYPRPMQQDYRGGSHTLTLSAETTAALRTLSQANSATVFMVLLAAFQLLLSRYTGQDDVIVGTPIAGRPTVETEAIVGMFLNSLALRSDLSGNPSFVELLKQVRQTTLEAYTHQQVPFERIVEEVKPERFLNRHPIFEVMLNYMSAPKSRFKLPGVASGFEPLRDIKAKLPMTLYVRDRGQTLNLQLVYQTALFKPERMSLFLEHLDRLLSQIVANSEASIHTYALGSTAAQGALPDPTTVIPEPAYPLVPELVFKLGACQPQHPAVACGGEQWAYGQLAQQAKTIAQHLLCQGLTSGDVVAVSGQRCFGLIASILGVLSSGGVLLTLDPALPVQRRQMMLAEAQAKYVIQLGNADDDTEMAIAALNRITVACHTAEVVTDLPLNQEITLPALAPEAPAYVFFTSGTTGKPKGVLGCHKGLAHFLTWQRQQFTIGPADRTAQLTGLSFDVVLRDILLPLTSGATLCIPAPEVALLPTRLLPWLDQQHISVLHAVPTLLKNWLANGPDGVTLSHLRWLFSAGEPLPDSLVQRWRNAFPKSGRIVNLYGPTETTLAKCYFEVPAPPVVGIQPIGTPLPDTQVLVLSKERRLCGTGEVGEIAIRTPFRTLGYINASAEQKRCFIVNPFRNDADDLIYCTGDRGRYRLDGSLDILGRIDHQVKIRGVRIEPREIEAALLQYSPIREAVVMAKPIKDGDKQLIAYIVPTENASPDADLSGATLRQHLKRYLAEAMIPTAFVTLEALPLTPNGKINRRALPEPPQKNTSDRETGVEPKDDLERQLVECFKAVLQVQSVGVNDDFFDLGGHSLIAVQLFAKIESLFGRSLPLATLFQATTVADLAALIRQENWLAPWHSLVPMQPKGSKPPIFYLHAGGGNLLVYRELMKAMGDDQPVYGIQPRGLDGNHDPFRTVEDMADYYLTLMRKVQPEGPYFLAGLSTGGTISWEIAQRLRQSGEGVGMLAMFDTSGPDYPRLMPLVPRLLSVTVWVMGDMVKNIVKNAVKLWRELSLESLNKAKNKILVKLGFKKRKLDAFQKTQRSNVQRQLNRKVATLDKSSKNPVEKWINLICIWLLRRSSKGYYANTFATGMVRHKPKEISESLQSLQSSIRKARKRYKLGVYPGEVVYFRASERPPGIVRDPLVGWSGMAEGGFDVYEIPGSHEGIMRSELLGKQLKICLEAAQEKHDPDVPNHTQNSDISE